MTPEIFERIVQLIAARTGLQARAKDRADWMRALENRLRTCRIGPLQYLELLQKGAVEETGEWRALLPALTNGESYFLRDKGQFALLRQRILPALIEARRAQKSLRLWSAGCSTGEEPYSLAMLAREIVPPGWDVSILGTDVNDVSLRKARRGQYSNWSFRALEEDKRARYFQTVAGNLEIRPELRQMVRFETDNLCDEAKSSGIRDMDLILCRNVLIYFSSEAIGRALSRFAGALREGGYLLTGHAELHHHDPHPLAALVYPESVIYQRPSAAISRPISPSAPLIPTPRNTRSETKITSRTPLSSSSPARAQIGAAPRKSAPQTAVSAPSNDGSTAQKCRRARACANAGQHEEAVECCQSAIAADATAVEAYLIWAQVAQEQGERERAKDLLKKVIYLAPSEVDAYLELGALYGAEGDGERARRMQVAALDVLRARVTKTSPVAAQAPKSDDLTGIIAHLETLLMPAAPQFQPNAMQGRRQ